jgi:hypothetical protein
MPPLDTVITVRLMHALLPLGPPHVRRLGVRQDTDHLVRHGQFGVDSRRERMNQLRPMMIPQPQHRATVRAEIPLRGASLLIRLAAIFDSGVFPAKSTQPGGFFFVG